MNNIKNFLFIPPRELGKGTNIKVEIVDTIEDTYHDFARVLLNEVKNNKAKKKTVIVLPVGPTEVYPKIVRMINLEKINCNNLIVINMDEYCNYAGNDYIPYSHDLSFRRFMDENFYSKINPELNIKRENRIFPDPKDLEAMVKKIEQLGGIDICIGSLGFTGHIAFNEPPESEENISVEEFKNLTTRVVDLTRETIVQSALKVGGNIDIIPKKAVTLGMKEILSAKKIFIYLMRDWQAAILRKSIHGPITPKVPGSLLQKHPCVNVVASFNAAKIPR